mgnify:CR=1 FL=1
MNAYDMAQRAYSAHAAPIRTARGTENDAISRVTRDLAAASVVTPADHGSLAAALHQNRRLWTLLAANVAEGNNLRPAGLRARIFYLAEFTDVHTRRVLRGTADVSALGEVNMAVLRGLADGGAR